MSIRNEYLDCLEIDICILKPIGLALVKLGTREGKIDVRKIGGSTEALCLGVMKPVSRGAKLSDSPIKFETFVFDNSKSAKIFLKKRRENVDHRACDEHVTDLFFILLLNQAL